LEGLGRTEPAVHEALEASHGAERPAADGATALGAIAPAALATAGAHPPYARDARLCHSLPLSTVGRRGAERRAHVASGPTSRRTAVIHSIRRGPAPPAARRALAGRDRYRDRVRLRQLGAVGVPRAHLEGHLAGREVG